MGVRYVSGYIYKCPNCDEVIEEENSFIKRLNPIKFDYLTKNCQKCNFKCRLENRNEFFTVNKRIYYINLFFAIINWLIVIGFLMICLQVKEPKVYYGVFSFFIIIYCIYFNIHWNNNIKKSKRRLNNERYIVDLLSLGILDLYSISTFYKNGIIEKSIYDKVISNIKENIK